MSGSVIDLMTLKREELTNPHSSTSKALKMKEIRNKFRSLKLKQEKNLLLLLFILLDGI